MTWPSSISTALEPQQATWLTPSVLLLLSLPPSPNSCHHQVRVTYWSVTRVLISWSTCDAVVSREVPRLATNASAAASAGPPVVLYGTAHGNYSREAIGVTTSYVYDYSEADDGAGLSYASPLIHHVLLTGELASC